MVQKNKRLTVEAKIIGTNLRYLREYIGLSQYEVACFLCVSYQQIQKYESGQNRLPIEKLFHLKNFYDVPYEVFFRDMGGAQRSLEHRLENSSASIYADLMGVQDKGLKKKIEEIILILVNYEQCSS